MQFAYLAGANLTRAKLVGANLRGANLTNANLTDAIGADLTEREVAWLVRTEWARTADDILWRRSKLGLRFTEAERAALETMMPMG